MTRNAVFMLFVCTGLAAGGPISTATTVALVPHFEKPLGPQILPWIAPILSEAFRPAGLSLEWYENRDAVPASAVRTLDVWFHGDCWPLAPRAYWDNSRTETVRLGWVHSHHGHIDQDVIVNCARIVQLADEARTATTNGALLNLVLLRLVARVVGHELLHVLLMSGSHGRSDFSSPQIQAGDWRRIGRLTHAEVQSLRRLYRPDSWVAWAPKR